MGRTSSLFCVDKKNKKQVPKLINLMERRGEIFTENVIEYCQVSPFDPVPLSRLNENRNINVVSIHLRSTCMH